jgi:hypothetical protein
MKTYRYETLLWLPQARARVFQFFADPRNLERLTPDWLHFEILTAPEIEMREGTLLDYRLRLRGIPLRWQSEIQVWQPPHRFIDRQTKVPTHSGCTNTLSPRRTMALLSAIESNMPCPAAGLCKNFLLRPISNGFFSSAIACLKSFSNRPGERRVNQSAANPARNLFHSSQCAGYMLSN